MTQAETVQHVVNDPPQDDTAARLLDAAGPVFAEKGFQATTVREICRAADVNVAAVNYHFGDKERLYIETVKRAHRLKSEAAPLPVWPADISPESKLKGFVTTLLTRMIGPEASPWQHELMMREMINPTAACRELVEDSIRPEFELLLSIIAELLPAGTTAAVKKRMAFTVVGQCLFYRIGAPVVGILVSDEQRQSHFSVEPLAEHITQVSLSAVQAVGNSP